MRRIGLRPRAWIVVSAVVSLVSAPLWVRAEGVHAGFFGLSLGGGHTFNRTGNGKLFNAFVYDCNIVEVYPERGFGVGLDLISGYENGIHRTIYTYPLRLFYRLPLGESEEETNREEKWREPAPGSPGWEIVHYQETSVGSIHPLSLKFTLSGNMLSRVRRIEPGACLWMQSTETEQYVRPEGEIGLRVHWATRARVQPLLYLLCGIHVGV